MARSRLGLLFLPFVLSAGSFEDFKNTQDNSYKQEKLKFIDFKKQEDKAFKTHLQKEKEAISAYRKKVKALWPESDLEEAKKLTTYSKDLHTKKMIDFKNNQITISKIKTNQKISKEELLKQLNKTLKLNNTQAFKENKLEQSINTLSKNSKYIKDSKLDKAPLLQVGTRPLEVKAKEVKMKVKGNVYEITYQLPKNSTYKRSYNYLIAAKSNAKRFNLKAETLLAIMHSESSFNPMARSHIPAYGLMQIVPRSAGIDSYKFLYKKRRLLSASYLYNTKQNIEIGSAYFHILYYKYLSSIKNPQSRLYCSIAGYNTGSGNVAWAFVRSYNVKKAAKIINKMTPSQVYNHLQKNLKYDEPKHYLKRVSERSIKYKELYRL